MKKNNKELLYEAMSDVRQDYIDQADDYEFKHRKPRVFAYCGIAAAACLAIGITIVGLSHEVGNDPDQKTAYTPSAAPTAVASTSDPNPTADISDRKVVYGNGEELHYERVINPGECLILGSLKEELEKEENVDALFYVEIDLIGVAKERKGEIRSNLLNALEEAQNDPVFLEFSDAFNIWWDEIKSPSMTAEEHKTFANDNSFDPYFGEFFEYTESTVSKEKADDYMAAKQRFDNAAYEYDNYDVPEDVIAIYEAEIDRLAALGYEFDRSTLDARAGIIKAYLTKAQIDDFSINPEYAYLIFFANDSNVMLED